MFAANFPGEPIVTTMTWETEYGPDSGTRLYGDPAGSADPLRHGDQLQPVEQILSERAKSCADDERCSGNTSYSGDGYWKNDVRGAMIYAAFKFMKRDVTLTHYTCGTTWAARPSKRTNCSL